MNGRLATLAVMSAGAALVAVSVGARPMPRLLWNASASVPVGLYGVQRLGKITKGILVVAIPPPPLAAFLAARGYLPLGVPLIKPVLALPGQRVCRDGPAITIDRVAAGTALAYDRQRRKLPAWRGCRRLAPGEVFLMSPRAASFDGRYFGPIAASAIVGRAVPVLTFARRHHGVFGASPPSTRIPEAFASPHQRAVIWSK